MLARSLNGGGARLTRSAATRPAAVVSRSRHNLRAVRQPAYAARAEMLGLRKSTRAFQEERLSRLVRVEGRVSRGRCRLQSTQSPRASRVASLATRLPTVSPSPVSSSESRDESRAGPSSPKVLARTCSSPLPPSRSRGRGNRSARRSSPRLQCHSSEHQWLRIRRASLRNTGADDRRSGLVIHSPR